MKIYSMLKCESVAKNFSFHWKITKIKIFLSRNYMINWFTTLLNQNLLSLASLACLRNSAAFVVFGKGLVVLLFFVGVLFNLIGLLPVKQEKSL